MQSVLAAVGPYLSNPLFQVLFSGVAASLVHSALRQRGISFGERGNFWFAVAFSCAPFLVLATEWGTSGLPAPDEFFTRILACFGASQGTYQILKSKIKGGTIDEIEIPDSAGTAVKKGNVIDLSHVDASNAAIVTPTVSQNTLPEATE